MTGAPEVSVADGPRGLKPAARGGARRGMTLIEVLVASVLLGVGVAGLIFSATLGMRNQERSGQRMQALYLAQAKLTEIEVAGPRIWSLTQASRGVTAAGDVTYEWSVEIDSMTEGELYDVQVQVNWSGSGGNGTVELETLLNDYEAVATLGTQGGSEESPPEANE